MSFELNQETAINVLIWWIGGADGSIDYEEEQAVKKVLRDLDQSSGTFYRETLLHVGALGTGEIRKLVEKAVDYIDGNFSESRKKKTVALLEYIAECNENVTAAQQEKLDGVKRRLLK